MTSTRIVASLSLLFLIATSLPSFGFYSPIRGRWLSRDPIGERGGLNLLGFCLNSPVLLVDPLGDEIRGGDPTMPYPPGYWPTPVPEPEPPESPMPPRPPSFIDTIIENFNPAVSIENYILDPNLIQRLQACECVSWLILRPSAFASAKRKSGLVLRGHIREVERFALTWWTNWVDNAQPYPKTGTVGCKAGQTCSTRYILFAGTVVLSTTTDTLVFLSPFIPVGMVTVTSGARVPAAVWAGRCQ